MITGMHTMWHFYSDLPAGLLKQRGALHAVLLVVAMLQVRVYGYDFGRPHVVCSMHALHVLNSSVVYMPLTYLMFACFGDGIAAERVCGFNQAQGIRCTST